MANQNDDFDIDDDDEDAGDSNAAKTLRKQNSKLNKELEDMRKQFAELQAKQKTADLASLLGKFNVEEKYRAKAAKYISRDIEGDVSEESVLAWLKEDGEMFGWSEDGSSDDSNSAPDPRADQARRITQATNSAPPAQSGNVSLQQLQAMSHADLIARGFISAK